MIHESFQRKHEKCELSVLKHVFRYRVIDTQIKLTILKFIEAATAYIKGIRKM